MNIESKRTHYGWNEITISSGPAEISVYLDSKDAEAFKNQLLDVISDLDELIEEYETTDEVE